MIQTDIHWEITDTFGGEAIGDPLENALWGVESDNAAYIREVAIGLASEIE